jgi:hypothetical protein
MGCLLALFAGLFPRIGLVIAHGGAGWSQRRQALGSPARA